MAGRSPILIPNPQGPATTAQAAAAADATAKDAAHDDLGTAHHGMLRSYVPECDFEAATAVNAWTQGAHLTITRTTVAGEVLDGTASGLITTSAGVAAGEFVATPAFTLPRAALSLPVGLRVICEPGGGSVAGDWSLSIWDVTAGAPLTLSEPVVALGKGDRYATFIASANTQYQVRVTYNGANVAGKTLILDNLVVLRRPRVETLTAVASSALRPGASAGPAIWSPGVAAATWQDTVGSFSSKHQALMFRHDCVLKGMSVVASYFFGRDVADSLKFHFSSVPANGAAPADMAPVVEVAFPMTAGAANEIEARCFANHLLKAKIRDSASNYTVLATLTTTATAGNRLFEGLRIVCQIEYPL